MSVSNENWRKLIELEFEKRTGVLDLSACGLEAVPIELSSMHWLSELNLSKNRISRIEGLEALENLVSLDLSINIIQKISGLERLKSLKKLFLSNNEINKIEGLSDLINLENLTLSYNYIRNIENLTALKNLIYVLLNYNQITKIEGFDGLENLVVIYLTNNEITKIEGISRLKKLSVIHLDYNKITSIIPVLPLLKNGYRINLLTTESSGVKFISMIGNPISDPPIETIQQGTGAILKYFAEKKTLRTEKLEILKLILVGNSQVGKSNFSQFLREGIISDKTKSTHVLDIQKWDADFLVSPTGTKTRLHLFDFGGQDYYHDAHRMYYSHDTAYILLWDTISNEYQEKEEMIDGVKDSILYENFPLPYWLQSINYTLDGKFVDTYNTGAAENANVNTEAVKETVTKAPPILVLQNKIDIANGRLNQEELNARYPNIWGYFGVSLLKKKRTEVLKELLSDYLYSLNLTGRTLLSYQLDIVKHFSENKDHVLHIYTLAEFREACLQIINDESVVFEERDALIMAHILNNTGIVLFHLDQAEPYIFTDIGILNEQIKTIMDSARKGNDKGVFLIKDVLKQEEAGHKEKILQLLSANKSIIRLSDKEYLAPQFLPTEAERSIQFFLHTFNNLQMRYVYPAYYHKSILLNLFAAYVEGIKDNFSVSSKSFPFWRNGIIVSRGEGLHKEMVFVEFVKNKQNALINIKTMMEFSGKKLEGEIERLIDSLNKGWTVTKEVSVDSNIFIPVEKLHEKFTTRQFEFVRDGKKFRINDFKNLVHFENRPKRIFISYSSLDKDYLTEFRKQIKTLQNEGVVETWDDRELQAGDKWDIVINEQLDKADYVVLFISANFLNSEYIRQVELEKALQKENGTRIIPIIIDYCTWQFDETLKDIQVLNKEKPLTSYVPISKGWVEVINDLKKILKK